MKSKNILKNLYSIIIGVIIGLYLIIGPFIISSYYNDFVINFVGEDIYSTYNYSLPKTCTHYHKGTTYYNQICLNDISNINTSDLNKLLLFSIHIKYNFSVIMLIYIIPLIPFGIYILNKINSSKKFKINKKIGLKQKL